MAVLQCVNLLFCTAMLLAGVGALFLEHCLLWPHRGGSTSSSRRPAGPGALRHWIRGRRARAGHWRRGQGGLVVLCQSCKHGDAKHALFTGGVDEMIVWPASVGFQAMLEVPPGLVRSVTQYGDAGHALVTGGVDKVSLLCAAIMLILNIESCMCTCCSRKWGCCRRPQHNYQHSLMCL